MSEPSFFSLQKRKEKLNNEIVWTNSIKQKIIDLDNYLQQLMNEAYDMAVELKEIHDNFISEGKTNYSDYNIEVSIIYEPYYEEHLSLPEDEIKMQETLAFFSKRKLFTVFATGIPDCTGNSKMVSRQSIISSGIFWQPKSKGSCGFKICELLYGILEDSINSYAVEDVTKMEKTYFYISAEVGLEYD